MQTMVLPCSSAAQSSYNDSHNEKVGRCATHTERSCHAKKKHVYVAMAGVEWWDDVLTPGSKITTAAKELCAARRFDSYHYYKSKLLFLGDIVYAAGIGFQSQGNIFTYQQVEKKPPKNVVMKRSSYRFSQEYQSSSSLNLDQVAPQWCHCRNSRSYQVYLSNIDSNCLTTPHTRQTFSFACSIDILLTSNKPDISCFSYFGVHFNWCFPTVQEHLVSN